ncbi:hypothetical protein [Nonomuraea pusilla]|uniref:Lipoprotein n=1 Tax=Nonomuraea pusilla TaxID=46177 RepID=A0A1H8GR47_9ACTN|nr:hypothetical protein [Nonomuraea pusilla]SEN45967.1 hypothetical protein SAMN05660976_07600 [Nonomuraea pusilla]
MGSHRSSRRSGAGRSPGAAVVLLAACLIGCTPATGTHPASVQACLDRAQRENAFSLNAVGDVLPSAERVRVEEWNGCDSAGNGAAVSILVAPAVRRDDLWEAFAEAGWSPPAPACSDDCGDAQLVKRVGRRLVGVAFGEKGGLRVDVAQADGCWDDDGYRCP